MKNRFLLLAISFLALKLNAQNVGIGINTPVATLHVSSTQTNPVIINGGSNMYISLNENNTYRGYIGSYAGNAEDVDFGTGASNTTGRLHLTIAASPRLTISAAGNVGIGTIVPTAKLHVNGNLLINGANTLEFGGGFIKEVNAGKIGYGTYVPDALNIVGAGSNSTNRRVWFYNEGGAGFEGDINLYNGSKITRNTTGSANLVPVAYGTIDGATATVLGGTGNFSVERIQAGLYRLTVTGETFQYNTHTWSLTLVENTTAAFIWGFPGTDSGGLIVSTVLYNAVNGADRKFSFVLYKN
ncbi:MAG: hypothetical protein QM791_05240 [Ferruginibacter sp.]